MRDRDQDAAGGRVVPGPRHHVDGPDVNPALGRISLLQRLVGNQAVATAIGQQQLPRPGSSGAATVLQRAELDVDYSVTGHGWDRIHQRGISQIQLERTLDAPTVVHDDGNARIYVSAFGGGNVCIRAVMSKGNPMTVITVMKITGKKRVARYVDRP